MTDPGLCGSCVHARVVETRTGSRFYRCGLSDTDPRFPRYPGLPVVRCSGKSYELRVTGYELIRDPTRNP